MKPKLFGPTRDMISRGQAQEIFEKWLETRAPQFCPYCNHPCMNCDIDRFGVLPPKKTVVAHSKSEMKRLQNQLGEEVEIRLNPEDDGC